MSTAHRVTRIIAGALLSGGVAVAGVGLAVCHDRYYAPGPGSHVIEGVPPPGPGGNGFP